MRKFLSILLVLVLVLSFASCSSDTSSTGQEADTAESSPASPEVGENAPVTIRFSEESADDHPLTSGAMKFKELVEAAGVNITVEVFPNGTIANEMSALEMVQLGTLDMTMCSTSTFANFVGAYNVFDLAYMITDEEMADAVLLGEFGDSMLELCTKANMIGIAFWENGFRNLTTNVEINSVEDFKGLKIRTMENPMHMAAWQALGADPTPMAFTELYTSLQQNVVDGQENPYANIVINGFYDVQDYFYTTRHVYTPMLIVFSQDIWNSLSTQQQEAIYSAGYEAGIYEREVNRDLNGEYEATLKEKMEFVEISDELREQMKEKMTSVNSQFEDLIGKEILAAYQNAIDSYLNG